MEKNKTIGLVELHRLVENSGKHNFEAVRIPIHSELQINKWEEYLFDYYDNRVVEFLKYGWPLNFDSEISPVSDLRNHKGAREFSSFICDYLKKETQLGRIAGPFTSPPLERLFISPLNTVPKTDPNERRVIVDLSWPKGISVNDGIQMDEYLGETYELLLPTVDSIISLIWSCGRGAMIYKRDLKSAYRQFGVDPRDYKYLGYYWKNEYYFDTVLCMGQRSAAMACQRSTQAVGYIHAKKGHHNCVYLDDFIGVSPLNSAWNGYFGLGELLEELGLNESLGKACPTSNTQICLGVQFDTMKMIISITADRLTRIRQLLKEWLKKKKASKRDIQSLIGQLSFISKCVPQSRIFLNRLLSVLRGMVKQTQVIVLTDDFKLDLRWWDEFVSIYNGASMIPEEQWSAPDAVICTDSCETGCGGYCGSEFFHSSFPGAILQQDLCIHNLEILAVVVAVRLWSGEVKGRKILVYCDNEASVSAINSGKSTDRFTAAALRELWYWCCLADFQIRALHIPGVENRLADYLSRWHLEEKYQHKFFNEFGHEGQERVVDEILFYFHCNF